MSIDMMQALTDPQAFERDFMELLLETYVAMLGGILSQAPAGIQVELTAECTAKAICRAAELLVERGIARWEGEMLVAVEGRTTPTPM